MQIVSDAGYAAWLTQQQQTKRPLAPAFHGYMTRWLAAAPANGGMPGTTFDSIIAFMRAGTVTHRLTVALADVGYTFEELTKRKEAGTTAEQLATEILARGIARDPDEDSGSGSGPD